MTECEYNADICFEKFDPPKKVQRIDLLSSIDNLHKANTELGNALNFILDFPHKSEEKTANAGFFLLNPEYAFSKMLECVQVSWKDLNFLYFLLSIA